ncbi:MAG: hypothetical protein CEN89_672 [Candidatus Berkelbacteria bacterium Licking1014_7]|uniref:Uncharacterized protein n=1 Tax=Candidatus Berkelbacteria bacterium Licking1014_7 TaxID=2017147 RepID=A0A554LI05_9BACT|nr:MAG: hypothetical protein CEN89_672 [Candidatus Berkelbacteria bacterium Licking1014_7]
MNVEKPENKGDFKVEPTEPERLSFDRVLLLWLEWYSVDEIRGKIAEEMAIRALGKKPIFSRVLRASEREDHQGVDFWIQFNGCTTEDGCDEEIGVQFTTAKTDSEVYRKKEEKYPRYVNVGATRPGAMPEKKPAILVQYNSSEFSRSINDFVIDCELARKNGAAMPEIVRYIPQHKHYQDPFDRISMEIIKQYRDSLSFERRRKFDGYLNQ